MSTRAYDEAVPSGASAANTLHTIIQDKGKDFRERLVQGDHKFAGYAAPPSGAADNADGKHCVGIRDNTGNAGSCVVVWDTAGAAARIEQFGSAHATKADQTEFPGDLVIPVGKKFKGGVSIAAGGAYGPVNLTGDGFLGNPSNSYWKGGAIYKAASTAGSPSRTLVGWRVVCSKAAATTPFIINLRQRDASAGQCADNLDPYADANSTQVASISVSTGNYAGVQSGLSVALDVDDELVIKIGATFGTILGNSVDKVGVILFVE